MELDIKKLLDSLKNEVSSEALECVNKALEKQGLKYEDGKIKSIDSSFKYKEGDFLYVKHDNYEWYMIFKKYEDNEIYNYVSKCQNSENIYMNPDVWGRFDFDVIIRPMTKREKKNFLTFLRDNHIYWNEKKHTITKVSPFKEGDWIIGPEKIPYEVIENKSKVYEVRGQNGFTTTFDREFIEVCWHKWTIEDAVEGDFIHIGACVDWKIILKKYENSCIYNYIALSETENLYDGTKDEYMIYWGPYRDDLVVRPMTFEEKTEFLEYLINKIDAYWDSLQKTFVPLYTWSIKTDAKDGDILYEGISGQIFMFKSIGNSSHERTYKDTVEYYCRVYEEDFYENENFFGYMGRASDGDFKVATKEQKEVFKKKLFSYLDEHPEKLKNIFK